MRKLLALVVGEIPMFQNTVPTAQAYTFSAPTGIAGAITRPDESVVEPAQLFPVSTTYPSSYGIGMKYTTGGIQAFNTGSEAATAFAGVLVREVPSISGLVADDTTANGTGSPWANNVPAGLCTRGYINVLCVYGTPTRGGTVYLRIVATSNNETVGTFDATSDSSNNVALTATQAEWASDGKDANNNAELRIAR